jgi:protein-L-isoaspartate(D-aspartate) O-methyltransferase
VIDLVLAREAMAERLDGIGFPASVVTAMASVPRHAFVPAPLWRLAYAETDLWLGATSLAAPIVMARTLAALGLRPGQSVLELGTGCGYQTALLAALGAEVFSIEPLGGFDLSAGALRPSPAIHRSLGGDVAVWRDHAPFDAIVVNGVLDKVSPDLTGQLAPKGGRLVAAMGTPARLAVMRPNGDGGMRLQDAGLVPARAGPHRGSVSSLGLSHPLEGAPTEP